MDLLKGELQRKRKAAVDDFGGKGFVRRSELEQKQLQKRRDEHRHKLLAKALEPARSPESAAASSPSEPGVAAGDPRRSSSIATASVPPAALDLPRHEVVRRLRVLRQPVTLFEEDDAARVERFNAVLKYGLVDDIDALDMTEGQTNEFLRDMIQTRKRHKAAKGRRVGVGGSGDGGAAGDSADYEDGASSDNDSERMNANFEELCEEDRILVFFKRLLDDWKQQLDAMTELEKRTAKGKLMIATFQQRARDLKPLFNLCRKKIVPDDIRQALLAIVECCMKYNHLAASEHYIKLAVGNAPWPIGVTGVGIHERSAREKIHAKSVAHIMNDETTRRYLQSIKGLITLCQPC